MVQRLTLCLPMQGVWGQSLVGELRSPHASRCGPPIFFKKSTQLLKNFKAIEPNYHLHLGHHDLVICLNNKKYIFGLCPRSWHRAPKTLGITEVGRAVKVSLVR